MKTLLSFISIKPYLSFLDRGIYRPFFWFYGLIAILNLLLPFSILERYSIFEYGNNYDDSIWGLFSVGLISIILVYTGWVNCKLWIERAIEIRDTYNAHNDFIIIPLVSHFIKTSGDSSGTWSMLLGIIGTLSYILLPHYFELLFPFSFLFTIILFISGFVIIVLFRFIAEQINVFAAIANNTKK